MDFDTLLAMTPADRFAWIGHGLGARNHLEWLAESFSSDQLVQLLDGYTDAQLLELSQGIIDHQFFFNAEDMAKLLAAIATKRGSLLPTPA